MQQMRKAKLSKYKYVYVLRWTSVQSDLAKGRIAVLSSLKSAPSRNHLDPL